MHPRELALGSIGFSLDRAWQHTLGRPDVVIAVLDSGIRWGHADLVHKLYLNPGELPKPEGSDIHDRNGDGVFNVLDYAGDSRVSDRNGNGRLDPQELIAVFSDCRDDDGNGYLDDISGYDFFAGEHCGVDAADNDPHDDTDFGHGTGIASSAAAEADNGIDDTGVCPRCSVLPVRVGDSFVVDANQFARGVLFAVRSGATVIASALGSYNNTPAARFAVDYAYEHGVAIIASAADEFSYHHNYPSVHNHTLYVNAIRYNHQSDWREGSTFWGLNPCTNFGARVWITVPATSCSSGATSRLAGVAGLLQSMALDLGLGRLHAEEVYQLLRMTADDLDNGSPDWVPLRYPAKPGFDQLYGYGRLNAEAAVRAVREKRIPPIVDLDGPRWFAVVSPQTEKNLAISGSIRLPRARRATYRLEYALGVEPREAELQLVSQGTVEGSHDGPLGVLSFDELPLPSVAPPRNREERDRYSVTLRLTATDERGLTGEARRSFFVLTDPTSEKHFPYDLGVSGEASPLLFDLDRDGRDEIILPTAAGEVLLIDWQPSALAVRRLPLDERSALVPGDATVGARELRRESAVRGAVVGDLDGDGRLSIVVASREGRVYAFDRNGARRSGFPVATDPARARPATEMRRIERGVLSTPLLVELDGKPGAEIVVTALDAHLYAWRGNGTALPGFPVPIENPRGAEGVRDKIVSSPAAGDLDGDGLPEIVFGSNGLRGGRTAAYAVRREGTRHPAGPYLPGWGPFEIEALRPKLLPTLATGIGMSPSLADLDGDGDDEVILFAVTGDSIVIVDQPRNGATRVVGRGSMAPGVGSDLRGMSFLAGTGSGHLADTDRDGTLEYYAPLLPLRMLTLRSKPGVPIDVPLALGGWELTRVGSDNPRLAMMDGYPRRMEDMMLFATAATADVDGDGSAEVLMGSGGYLLHAFRGDGGEARGFPKFTGGWTFSTPAVGDLDGDGRKELVSVTREGYLFAWELGG